MNVGRARVTGGLCDNCSRSSSEVYADRETRRQLCGWCKHHSPMARARAKLRAACEGRKDDGPTP